MKIQPWLLRLIEKFLLVDIAMVVKRNEAIRSLRIIIVTGFISRSNVFVATKDVPQKTTAKSMSK